MKRFLKIVIRSLVLLIIAMYLFFAGRSVGKNSENDIVCKELKVVIADSERAGFITETMVHNWFKERAMTVVGKPLSQINTLEIRDMVMSHSYVSNASVYKNVSGQLCVELTQRRPMIRFETNSGHSCYLTDDGWLIPTQSRYSVDVPIVTGDLRLPAYGKIYNSTENENVEKKFAENYEFLYKLINFVRFLEGNSDLKLMFVQINVVKNSEVELVPRVGNHIVLLGGVDRYEQKLEKLNKFYTEGLGYDSWNKYKVINLKYENQVVCSK
jgi:cell division protein FtsQ